MQVISVSEYLQILNDTLAAVDPYRELCVEGEVADFKISQNKWVWFDLKDGGGLISCFLTAWQLKVELEDGMKIRVKGFTSIYKKSGRLSFQVKEIELAGEGALKKNYELLKKKLEKEGLFDAARKRAIPRFPNRLALITSAEAAAYTDFLRILNNRWGGLEVDLLPVAVQGQNAIEEIAGAFQWLNDRAENYDVCVLTRGGGSMEDLIAFNSEEVARAVYSSRIPVICGIGHERDECLAEYVADVRASTPSNAAERAVSDKREILSELSFLAEQLENNWRRRIVSVNYEIDQIFSLIEHEARRPLDLGRGLLVDFEHCFDRFLFQIQKYQTGTVNFEKIFENFNPRRLLSRGYSIVRGPSGLIRDSGQVSVGEEIVIELGRGSLGAEVKEQS